MAEWERSGAKCLKALANDDPATLVKVAASLMPKDINVNVGLGEQLAEFLERMQDIRQINRRYPRPGCSWR